MPRVIYIPGLPGSELLRQTPGGTRKVFPPSVFAALRGPSDELKGYLKGPDDLDQDDGVFSGEPIRTTRFLGFDLMKQADTLYDLLAACGVPPSNQERVGWDWRRPVTDDALDDAPDRPGSILPRLAALLANAPEPMFVVAHSTGGLIVRHLLERRPDLHSKVARFIAFGVPWGGTLKPFAVLTGNHGFGPVSAADSQEIFASTWSALDVLPRDNSVGLVRNLADETINPLTDLSWATSFRDQIGPRAAHSAANLGTPGREWNLPVPVTNVAGWGRPTLIAAILRPGGEVVFNPTGLDNDDQQPDVVNQPEAFYEGDGTVPFASASWLQGDNVTHHYVPIGAVAHVTNSNRPHSELWRNNGVAALMKSLLADQEPENFTTAAVDWSDKLNPGGPVRIRYVLRDASGNPLPAAQARLVNMVGGNERVSEPRADGRGRFDDVPRGNFLRTQGGRFRRVEFRPTWQGAPRQPIQRMFIEP